MKSAILRAAGVSIISSCSDAIAPALDTCSDDVTPVVDTKVITEADACPSTETRDRFRLLEGVVGEAAVRLPTRLFNFVASVLVCSINSITLAVSLLFSLFNRSRSFAFSSRSFAFSSRSFACSSRSSASSLWRSKASDYALNQHGTVKTYVPTELELHSLHHPTSPHTEPEHSTQQNET